MPTHPPPPPLLSCFFSRSNVSIVGHYIKDRTRDAQFIIISLRNNMFELADRLVGIYKTHNMTKVSVRGVVRGVCDEPDCGATRVRVSWLR